MRKYLILLLFISLLGGCRAVKKTTTTETTLLTIPGITVTKDFRLPVDTLVAGEIVALPAAKLNPQQKKIIRQAIVQELQKRPVLTQPVTLDTLGLKLTLKPTTGGIQAILGQQAQTIQTTKTTVKAGKPAAVSFLNTLNWTIFLGGLVLLLILYFFRR